MPVYDDFRNLSAPQVSGYVTRVEGAEFFFPKSHAQEAIHSVGNMYLAAAR